MYTMDDVWQAAIDRSAAVLINACIADLDKLPAKSPEREKLYRMIDSAVRDADRDNPVVDIQIGRANGAGWGL